LGMACLEFRGVDAGLNPFLVQPAPQFSAALNIFIVLPCHCYGAGTALRPGRARGFRKNRYSKYIIFRVIPPSTTKFWPVMKPA
jgi:hypothetical protein